MNTRRNKHVGAHHAESFPKGRSYYLSDATHQLKNMLVCLPSGLAFALGLLAGGALA